MISVDDCLIIGSQRNLKTHSYTYSCQCGSQDNFEATPLDIALRNGACAEIINLLSLTPDEVLSLGGEEMRQLYA